MRSPHCSGATHASGRESFDILRAWRDTLDVNFTPQRLEIAQYNHRQVRNANSMRLVISIGGVVITDITWDQVTNLIDAIARPQLIMTWGEFFSWIDWQGQFFAAIQQMP